LKKVVGSGNARLPIIGTLQKPCSDQQERNGRGCGMLWYSNFYKATIAESHVTMPRYTWIDRRVLCAIAARYEQPAGCRFIKAHVQEATDVHLRDAELIWSVKRLMQGRWIKEVGAAYRLTARTVRMAPALLQEPDTGHESALNRILR
jgi:hypothetical protein